MLLFEIRVLITYWTKEFAATSFQLHQQ